MDNYGPYYDSPDDYEDVYIFDVLVTKETDKAFLVHWNGESFWCPKSKSTLFKGVSTTTLKVESWVLDKENINY